MKCVFQMTKNRIITFKNILFSSCTIKKKYRTFATPYTKCEAKSSQTIQRLIINLIPPLKNI